MTNYVWFVSWTLTLDCSISVRQWKKYFLLSTSPLQCRSTTTPSPIQVSSRASNFILFFFFSIHSIVSVLWGCETLFWCCCSIKSLVCSWLFLMSPLCSKRFFYYCFSRNLSLLCCCFFVPFPSLFGRCTSMDDSQ